jgi:aryl sulfotransferase
MARAPQRSRTYQNHHLDSTRWDGFIPRPDDIVIATSYKAGTTWTQAIVGNILFPDQDFPAPVWQMSPWLDFRIAPLDETLAELEAQRHRRFIKTHLPLDGLRFFPETKYIFVSRDGRDVFMSLWNHYVNHTDEAIAMFNDTPGRVGPPLPRAPADIHEFWEAWCTRGWFVGETDGWPYWSHLTVTQSWWNYRHLPNILTLHYADIKADTSAAVRRIADFIGVDISKSRLHHIVAAVSFNTMKQQSDTYAPRGGEPWKGGAKTFLNKGTNGRWRDVLSDNELALYDKACERALSPDCREWLENGGTVANTPGNDHRT